MLATYTAPERTELSFEVAAAAMRAALTEVLGADPHSMVLALALAKTALETGRWSSMWNGNWGNVKCSDKWPGLFTCISLNEVGPAGVSWYSPEGLLNRKGGEVIAERSAVPPGHPQTRMRAFATPAEGVLDYCRFVAGGHYAAAWQQLLAGNADGYVHELKAAHYFTADEEQYKRGVVSLQKEFVAKLRNQPALEPAFEVPHPDEVRNWLAPQDIVALEGLLADRYFDLLEGPARALREAEGDS